MSIAEFDQDLPLAAYDPAIAELFQVHAGALLFELQEHYLNVVLVPAPDPKFIGHKIRATDNHNPTWYRELYEDQRIRRRFVARSLERISTGADLAFDGRAHTRSSRYDSLLRSIILKHMLEGHEECIGAGYVHYEEPEPAVLEALVAYFGPPPAPDAHPARAPSSLPPSASQNPIRAYAADD